MPMPSPRKDEQHDEFVDRCMSDENMQEFEDPAQRRAVCESQWRKKEQGMKQSYILQAVMETAWAILPGKLAILVEIVTRHVAGEKLDAEEVQQRIHGARRPADRRAGNVAVLPLFGTIFPRANLMTQMSGATSAEIYGKQFAGLVKDPDIGAIVLDVDSPGGEVSGIDELSRLIYDARGQKPIVAVANHVMASAAYWIGTAADEVVVTPSASVGSIGVFAVHEDLSEALAQAGVKVSLISEGKYKTEGSPFEPLTDEARAHIQELVGDFYDLFIKAVARNRGVKTSDVRSGYGEGRVISARQAVSLGMADRIETLDEVIDRLQRGASRRRGASADGYALHSLDFRRRRRRLIENTGSVEPGKASP